MKLETGFRRIVQFFSLRRKNRSCSRSAADGSADSRAFLAAGDCADGGAKARSTTDNCGITTLCRFGDGDVLFRFDLNGACRQALST